MRVLDSGRPRTAYNAATIAGLDYSSRDIAAVRAAVAGCSRENVILTTSEVLDACVALEDSLGFIHAIARSNVGRGINGTTLAVGLRGFYHIEADRLNLFFECLKSGVVSCDEDNAAARLLQRINSTSNGGGSAFRRDLYMRTQNALLKFSQRQPIKMLYPADSEKFPWPERIANRLEKGVTRGNSRSLHTTPG